MHLSYGEFCNHQFLNEITAV